MKHSSTIYGSRTSPRTAPDWRSRWRLTATALSRTGKSLTVRAGGDKEDPSAMHTPAPFVHEDDVHLRIWLNGAFFDYRATRIAAHSFIQDWKRNRAETVELTGRTIAELDSLPRLPCERLYTTP
ncbi:hypothetical protein ABZ894_03210 [Nocardia beijingensis]|uniref:hypothetical protein n=1 Tax=Nocardia beijingensis TaxID=95162 RepID=UPI003410E15B